MKIGTTTVEANDIVSFEFFPSATSGGDTGNSVKASLRADFADGHSATTHGDEAVTLKVLLASLGVRDLSAHAHAEQPPAIPAKK